MHCSDFRRCGIPTGMPEERRCRGLPDLHEPDRTEAPVEPMTSANTGATSPLHIANVVPDRCWARIVITLFPRQTDPHGMTCAWNRQLDCDVDVVERWGATSIVTLITGRGMALLGVGRLRDAAEARYFPVWPLNMEW